MIDLLLLLLRPALWCADAGVWHRWIYMWPVVLVAWLLDVVITHTTWYVIAGRPHPKEWTISATLERLCVTPSPDRPFYIELARKINRLSPTGRHIKGL